MSRSQFPLTAIRRNLRRQKIGGLVVTHLPNIRYLTGFTGSTALTLVTARSCFLLLDSRYVEQGRKEAQNAVIVPVEGEAWRRLAQLIGSLRLGRVGYEFRSTRCDLFWNLKRALAGVSLTPQDSLVEGLRRTKKTGEVEAIRKAMRLTERAFREVLPLVRPGVREIELAAELEFRLRRKGAQAFSFETIIASGCRSALPHGVASMKRIQANDPIVMDFGIYLGGYVSDFTRTVVLGKATEKFRDHYRAVRGALEAVEESPLAGKPARAVDGICRSYLERAGLGYYFSHATGHGIGLEIHEAPSINPHSAAMIQPHDVFTVEPGVYLPGQFGIRIEDVVWVKENGGVRLNRSTCELIEL
ncbi:MAG: aminopeptidase P family protein [Acidobacteria bacterium]|nr:aminopeptidase P family protein [Acidobacteriota bacterium]